MILSKIFSIIHASEPVNNGHEDIEKYTLTFKDNVYKTYTRQDHRESAIRTFSLEQKIITILGLILILILGFINFKSTLISLIVLLTFFYFLDLLFKLYLIILSLNKSPEIKITDEEITQRNSWPIYSIICPLYKEPEMAKNFIKAICNLDYPKNKLQVLMVLEEDDKNTIEIIDSLKLPDYIKTLIVPHGEPKTKPKACNYALHHVTGEYVVIYDAEDVPDRDQLKKSVLAFSKLNDEKVICLQAKLNYYNSNQNLLTRLFTLEYSQWFDLILTGLHQISVPIPLGGTSNHFKREALNILQGWDPFNVTEDCDLGIRIYKNGYKTKILDSVTWEEANSSIKGWIKQRSRWVKGYFQTYFVHTKTINKLHSNFSITNNFAFQLIVGGTPLSMIINPIMWTVTISYFVFRAIIGASIEQFFPTFVFYIAILSLVFGNFLYILYYMLGAAKRNNYTLVKWAFFVPLYWVLMSTAAWIAIFQLILKPFHWEKTTHGLHLNTKAATAYHSLLA